VTGACGAILPVRLTLAPEAGPERTAPARAAQLLRGLVAEWRGEADVAPSVGLATARVRAARVGALALVRQEAGGVELVGCVGTRVSDSPEHVLEAARLARGSDAPWDDDVALPVMGRLESWLAGRAGATAAGVGHTIAGAARRLAMQRIAHIAARTPRHHRAQVAPLAADARRIVTAPYGVGAERILAELAGAPLPDEAWLQAVRAFGEANCRSGKGPNGPGGGQRLEAVIIFGP
jgi:hypothetical protein